MVPIYFVHLSGERHSKVKNISQSLLQEYYDPGQSLNPDHSIQKLVNWPFGHYVSQDNLENHHKFLESTPHLPIIIWIFFKVHVNMYLHPLWKRSNNGHFPEIKHEKMESFLSYFIVFQGTFLVTQAVAKLMVSEKVTNGSIINLASIVGKVHVILQCKNCTTQIL